MNHLPPRFKPELVYRFVPYLKQVIEGQSEVKFHPADVHLGIESAKGRLRDAAIALSKGFVFHPEINAQGLASAWTDYKVIDDLGYICIQRRHSETEPPSGGKAGKLINTTLRVEEEGFEEDLIAFARLLGRYRLEGGLIILGMLDEDLKRRLQQNSNVYIRQDKPNEHIMT